MTFRLVDAMPAEKRMEWEEILHLTDNAVRREKIEVYLNAGYGACWLKDERVAALVENALIYFDVSRYRLLAWVVMPNHVHVVIEVFPGFPLGQIVHSWKSFSAKEANRLLNRQGQFWQEDYFDRFIRDEEHLSNAIRYVHQNPVKANLVSQAEAWRFSSARYWETGKMGL